VDLDVASRRVAVVRTGLRYTPDAPGTAAHIPHTENMLYLLTRLLGLLVVASVLSSADITITAGDELARKPEAERTAAIATRWTATTVSLPEGNLTLTAALALVGINDNSISLGDGIDPTRAADLRSFTGDWWSAVVMLCDAYDLDIAPGQEPGTDATDQRGFRDGTPLGISGGPVVLMPRSPGSGPRIACGPLLIETHELTLTKRDGADDNSAEIRVRARAEPRFPLRDIGRMSVLWDAPMADDIAADFQVRPTGDGQTTRLMLRKLPSQTTRLNLRGSITVNAYAPLRVATSLQPGDKVTIDLGENQLLLSLLTAEQGRAAGKRAACVMLTYPVTALGSAVEMNVLVDHKPVPSNGSSRSQNQAGECEQVRFLNGLADDAACEVVIESTQPLGSIELPLALALDLTALPTTTSNGPAADAADVASSLALPGGDMSLSDALQVLRAGGSEVLLDLGVDGRGRATIPAARLNFWDATLAITKAFNLDLMPPQATDVAAPMRVRSGNVRFQHGGEAARGESVRLCGGPLGIGRLKDSERPLAYTASGPVLTEVMRVERSERQSLLGSTRLANVQLRLRLEPRIARELVSDAQIVWATAANDDTGTRLVVGRPELEGDSDEDPRPENNTLAVQVSGLSPATHRFTLAGQLQVRLQRQVRSELGLELGGPVTTTRLGARSFSVGIVEGHNGEPGGVQLSYASNRVSNNDFQLVVRGPDGIELAMRGRSSRGGGQRQVDTWNVAGLQPGTRYTVILSSNEVIATPVIALTIPVELP